MVLVGAPLGVISFQLSQRFQLVNALSGIDAGVRLLPFGGTFPVGAIASSRLIDMGKIPAVYFATF